MQKRGDILIRLDRKVALVCTFALVLLLIGIVTVAGPVNSALPWHFLQQVAKGPADPNTVDANNNGIIDEAENAFTLNNSNPSEWCRVDDTRTGCASGGGGAPPGTVTGIFEAGNPSPWSQYPASEGWHASCASWTGNVEYGNTGGGWAGAIVCRCKPPLVAVVANDKNTIYCTVGPNTVCTPSQNYATAVCT